LVIGEGERVACERLRQDRCAGKPRIVAQLVTGDGGIEEDLSQTQRHAHPDRLSVLTPDPVGVDVAAKDILHRAGDHAERDHSCVSTRQPQRDVVTRLDLVAVTSDRPALELVPIGEEFMHPPLGRVALHQPMRHDAPWTGDPRTLSSPPRRLQQSSPAR
jgi:hypothetical protein